jgi:hypothetical protein
VSASESATVFVTRPQCGAGSTVAEINGKSSGRPKGVSLQAFAQPGKSAANIANKFGNRSPAIAVNFRICQSEEKR